MEIEKNLWKHRLALKTQAPLVHNMTNYVVMNNSANALLAVGASPIMAHAKREVKDMVALAAAVVINIGTLDEYWAESMIMAAQAAHQMGKPWVLDPVGAGATAFRDEVLQSLMACKPTVIRGNASEIIALHKANTSPTKGVDSTAQSDEAILAARGLVAQHNTIVCISGATDIVTDNQQTIFLNNGHTLMTKVTGLGCTASALIGAFLAVSNNKLEATAAAMALLGIAGELGQKQSAGPGSLQVNLIDTLYSLREDEFYAQLKITANES